MGFSPESYTVMTMRRLQKKKYYFYSKFFRLSYLFLVGNCRFYCSKTYASDNKNYKTNYDKN